MNKQNQKNKDISRTVQLVHCILLCKPHNAMNHLQKVTAHSKVRERGSENPAENKQNQKTKIYVETIMLKESN